VKKHFTALERIVLCKADQNGRVILPVSPVEETKVYLAVLIKLRMRGFAELEKGSSPLLPFFLTRAGMRARNALLSSVNSQSP
jgi:hypothetical protein